MAKIKICGLRRRQDIDFVNAVHPDYIGFILTSGFRRSIDFETARQLKSRLDKGIKAVGVFVDDDTDKINKFADCGIIDIAQLHGSEDVENCKKVKIPVIKAFKPCDFDKIGDYENCADYFLFDSGTGSGKTFDWDMLPKTDKLFFLAGGLNFGNVKAAIEKLNPFAVDVSSSVETNGVKDFDKIKKFTEIMRNE